MVRLSAKHGQHTAFVKGYYDNSVRQLRLSDREAGSRLNNAEALEHRGIDGLPASAPR